MDEPFDALNVHKDAKVDNTSHYTLDGVTDGHLLKSLCQTFFDCFLFRENQLVGFAVSVEDARTQLFVDECVEALQYLVLVA